MNMHVNPIDLTQRFLRGVQVTNQEGLVEFRFTRTLFSAKW